MSAHHEGSVGERLPNDQFITEPNIPLHERLFTRRAANKLGAASVAAGSLVLNRFAGDLIGGAFSDEAHGTATDQAHSPAGGEHSPAQQGDLEAEPGAKEHGLGRANKATALTQTGIFTGMVGLNALGMKSFDADTALVAWTGELGRLLALRAAGDKEAFDHDMDEFFAFQPSKGMIGSVYFVPALGIMAETASNVRVDLEQLRAKPAQTEDIENKISAADRAVEEVVTSLFIDVHMPSEPGPNASADEWRAYSKASRSNANEILGIGLGSARTFNKVGTTYIGSQIMNAVNKRHHEATYYAEYGELMARNVEAGSSNTIAELKGVAAQRATKFSRGVWGVTKLGIAGPANGDGTTGLGDPPNVVFDLGHLDNLGAIPRAEITGLVLSEVTSNINALTFMVAHGGSIADIREMGMSIYRGQIKAYKALSNSLFSGEFRDISWSGNRNAADFVGQIAQQLGGSEDSQHLIRNRLLRIAEPVLQLDMQTFLRNKAEYMMDNISEANGILGIVKKQIADQFLGGTSDKVTLPDEYEDGINEAEFDTLRNDARFIAEFSRQDGEDNNAYTRRITGLADKVMDRRRDGEIADMASLFARLLNASVDEDGHAQPLDASILDKLLIDDDKELWSTGSYKMFAGLKREFRRRRMAGNISQKAAELLDSASGTISTEDFDTIVDLLGASTAIDPDMLRAAVGMAINTHRGVDTDDTDIDSLFGHAAKEVMGAVGTQVAFVPSLVVVAKMLLDKIDGFDNKIRAANALTVIVTAFGDNVAAYLFGKNVTSELYRERMGAERFDNDKNLKAWIAIGSRLMAEQAGSFTLLGNGPNFLAEGQEGSIDEQGDLVQTAMPYSKELASSMINPYAWTQTAVTYFVTQKLIKNALPDDFDLAA